MDFQELIQRAALNQVTVEKKHERQKIAKEETKRQVEKEEVDLRRKAASQLKSTKEQANKDKMKYKGMQSPVTTIGTKSKVPLPSPISTRTSKPHSRSHDKDKNKSVSGTKSTKPNTVNTKTNTINTKTNTINTKTTTSNAKTNTVNTKSSSNITGTVKGTSQTLKVKGKSKSRSSSPLIEHARGSPTGHAHGSPTGHACGSSTEHARGSPNRNTMMRSKPSSTNYHELMRLAQQNSSHVRKHDVKNHGSLREVKSKGLTPNTSSSRSSSPLGKSLIERANQKAWYQDTHHPILSTPPTKIIDHKTEDCRPNTRKERVNVIGKERVNAAGKERVNVTGKAGGGVTHSISTELTRRPLRIPQGRGGGGGGANQSNYSAGRVRCGISKSVASATAFYGSAAAQILKKDVKSSPYLGSRYTSTWVDEMSLYMKSNPLDPQEEEEEEEEDLDGFVASDEEYLDEGDDVISTNYSAEIAKIFGYDRTKFQNEDTTIMESSYAQQEFEELRSARIGHLEDEEDLIRERKRKKLVPQGRGGTKQTKLSF